MHATVRSAVGRTDGAERSDARMLLQFQQRGGGAHATCEMMEHTQQFKQILIKGLRTNRRAGRNRMAAGRVLQLRPQPNKGHPRRQRIDRKQATRGGRAAKLLLMLRG
jgi:hypothetical protein